jgi:hypothetical protein
VRSACCGRGGCFDGRGFAVATGRREPKTIAIARPLVTDYLGDPEVRRRDPGVRHQLSCPGWSRRCLPTRSPRPPRPPRCSPSSSAPGRPCTRPAVRAHGGGRDALHLGRAARRRSGCGGRDQRLRRTGGTHGPANDLTPDAKSQTGEGSRLFIATDSSTLHVVK